MFAVLSFSNHKNACHTAIMQFILVYTPFQQFLNLPLLFHTNFKPPSSSFRAATISRSCATASSFSKAYCSLAFLSSFLSLSCSNEIISQLGQSLHTKCHGNTSSSAFVFAIASFSLVCSSCLRAIIAPDKEALCSKSISTNLKN